jgi:hypothetical protein
MKKKNISEDLRDSRIKNKQERFGEGIADYTDFIFICEICEICG